MSTLTLKRPISQLEADALRESYKNGAPRGKVVRTDLPLSRGAARFQERAGGRVAFPGIDRDSRFAQADAALRQGFQEVDRNAARAAVRADYEAQGITVHEPAPPEHDTDKTR
ncbi:MAG: hypothetical protein GC134_04080 [Proteobacteria bacterium]|nr:hypothetical protein [Pseudomonadota bacterium]